ncbi:uncharacterized protein BO80DRAFT_398788 [Aspergillus ibericus CBS 121593]|uniref:Mid2 domain-containing protein n=1 Tax=Aspergillus ibericus CBS 121593 TaxID=1448316 RepID=A0A395HA08_9EURO|nr:hypothetical protein BO80DRAFT_398788 [Aspergillus ibericus CBS 121593]RAL04510.1 hypothetical protein BO80DRAFT_398788 [Aspergillus ibericus CBS 121593]
MMFGGILGRIAYLVCLLLALQERGFVRAEGFTFPTSTEYEFIVGDLVNVSWNVVTSRVSLYEVCSSAVALDMPVNVTNDYSYVWNATRDNYRESGCAFELEPLDYNGDPNPPNLTSVLFGVSKRYSGDPAPVSYNFYGTTSTTTSTATATSSTSSTTSTAVAETSAASSIDPAVARKSGLTVAQKVGIGLGVPLGVLAIAVLGGALALLYRRRSRKQRNSEHYPNTDQAASPMMVEEAKVPSDPRMSRAETLIAELPSHSDLGGIDEMEDNRPISELMGTPRNELH